MLRFYICRTCGNVTEMIEDSGVVPNCCGEDMEEMIPGITDGAKEKHIPVFTEISDLSSQDDSIPCMRLIEVKVGSMPHPMDKSHLIEWILVWTNAGVYRKNLANSDTASAKFCLGKDEKIKAIYAYCNLHGLWINPVKE